MKGADTRVRFPKKTRIRLVPWLVAFSVAAAGCAQGDGPRGASAAELPSTAARAPTPRPSPEQSSRTLAFDIGPMGLQAELDGTVVVEIGSGGYTIAVVVEGLQAGGHYPVNLHHGACPVPDTTWDSWLDQAAAADERGRLRVERTYTQPWEVPPDGLTLTIHGVAPLSAREHIGCADLTEQ